MKRLLPFLIVLLTLTINSWYGQDDVLSEAEASLTCIDTSAADTETVWLRGDQQSRQTALLSDASHLYRICNSRPQRLLPSQGAKNERTVGKLPFALCNNQNVKLKNSFGGSAVADLPAVHFAASCDYYVYALRRILR